MKRTITILLVCALAFIIQTAMATDEPQGAKAFVEQVILPAIGNPEQVEWTDEELLQLRQSAIEWQLFPQETIDALFEQKDSIRKEGLLRAILYQEKGMNITTWPIEEQAWMSALMVKSGLASFQYAVVPEAGDISQKEALRIASDEINNRWGVQIDLARQTSWRTNMTYQVVQENPSTQSRMWNIWLEPINVNDNEYSLIIRHDGTVQDASIGYGAQATEVTPYEVQDRYQLIHGDMITWDYETWTAFQADLRVAIEATPPDQIMGNIRLFLEQVYGKPTADMLTKEQAISIAIALPEAPQNTDSSYNGAVLLMDRDVPVWKVRLIPQVEPGKRSLPFLVEVDARDGNVRNFRQTQPDNYQYRLNYVLESLAAEALASPPEALMISSVAPTPRPDGKPWFWYSPKAPQHYWQALDALVEGTEVNDLLDQWFQEYGRDEGFWPLEAQAFMQLWGYSEPLDGTFPGLPEPGDISQEKALSIAREALINNGFNKDELDTLTPLYSFVYNNGISTDRLWMIDFVRLGEGWAERIEGVTIDAITGNVIAIGGNG